MATSRSMPDCGEVRRPPRAARAHRARGGRRSAGRCPCPAGRPRPSAGSSSRSAGIGVDHEAEVGVHLAGGAVLAVGEQRAAACGSPGGRPSTWPPSGTAHGSRPRRRARPWSRRRASSASRRAPPCRPPGPAGCARRGGRAARRRTRRRPRGRPPAPRRSRTPRRRTRPRTRWRAPGSREPVATSSASGTSGQVGRERAGDPPRRQHAPSDRLHGPHAYRRSPREPRRAPRRRSNDIDVFPRL